MYFLQYSNTNIKDLCISESKQLFSEAMKLANHFELHEKFDVDLFIIPLVLKVIPMTDIK